MIRKTLIVSMHSLILITASGQSEYCRLIEKKRPINFYWDWHIEYDYKAPAGVSIEKIFHQEIDNKDSVLERETHYNQHELRLIDKRYAVPTKEGAISIDSFIYDQNNLLIQINRRYLSCVLGKISVTVRYEYDSLQREILRVEDGPDANSIETIYRYSNKIIKQAVFSDGTSDIREVHFYSFGKEDSMQVFRWGKWYYTTEFVYDTVRLAKKGIYKIQRRQSVKKQIFV